MAQHYTRISESPEEIVFQDNSGSILLAIIFGLVGLPMLSIGLYMTYNAYSAGESMGLPLILAGAGMAFFSVVFLVIFTREDNPYQIIFDNANGCVRLKQKEKYIGISEAIIPYEDIDGFGIRTRTSSSSSGGSRTRYYYQIYWQKRDGGRWDLLYYSSRNKSEEYLQWLQEHVDLSRSCRESMDAQLPQRVVYSKLRGHDSLQWKNPVDSIYFLFGSIIAGFSVTAAGTILKFEAAGDDTWVGWIFLAFCVLISLGLIYNIYKELTTTYALLLTSHELQFLEISGGEEKVRHAIPYEEIGSVTFDFDENQGGGMMAVFTKEQLAKILNRSQESMDWSAIWSHIRSLTSTPRIKLKVPVVERVHVERYLQDLLAKKGGGHVL